jgi:hypothetical protein
VILLSTISLSFFVLMLDYVIRFIIYSVVLDICLEVRFLSFESPYSMVFLRVELVKSIFLEKSAFTAVKRTSIFFIYSSRVLVWISLVCSIFFVRLFLMPVMV